MATDHAQDDYAGYGNILESLTRRAEAAEAALVEALNDIDRWRGELAEARQAADAEAQLADEFKAALMHEKEQYAKVAGELVEARQERDEAQDALQSLAQDHYFARAERAEAERDALAAALRTCADAIEDIKGDVYLHALGSIDADTALSGISKSLQAVREIPSVSPSTQADVADQ